MNLTNELNYMYSEALKLNSGSLSYTSGSTTLSASCYVSFGQAEKWETQDNGYQRKFIDYSVIAKNADIQDWHLVPKESKVSVNNINYYVGGMMTKTDVYTWITLRPDNDSI